MDVVKNFAKVSVSIGYAAGATSITLSTGHGAKLPDPAADGAFNLVWWNVTDYPDPTDDSSAEIVRCTARAGDVLTVTRAQESTADVAHNAATKTYQMILSLTKKMIDDISSEMIRNIVEDTTPQLGGNLDMQTHKLVGEGGSDGVYIDSSGNVGIGTNAPGHLLEILGKGNTYENYSMYVTDSVGERQFAIRDDGRAYFGPTTSYIDTISTGWIKMVSAGVIIQATGGNLILKGDDDAADNAIVFMNEGGAEHMRVVTGTTNTGNVGIDTTTPTAKLDVNSDILRLRTAKTPATAGAAGNQGDICWDADYFYICVATNTWKRSAIATW